jgi:hypothetical protein
VPPDRLGGCDTVRLPRSHDDRNGVSAVVVPALSAVPDI